MSRGLREHPILQKDMREYRSNGDTFLPPSGVLHDHQRLSGEGKRCVSHDDINDGDHLHQVVHEDGRRW